MRKGIPQLLVVASVFLDVSLVLLAALVVEPKSAIYFGAVLLIGTILGHELYLRTGRPANLLREGRHLDRSPRRSSPLASIDHLLGRDGDETKEINRRLMKLSRWASLSRLNYPMLIVGVALSSPILAALLFSLKPILTSVVFQKILDKRVYLAHSPIPTANERETEPTKMAIDAMYQRVSLFRWILILLSAGGAVLVIIATGSTGGEPEETPVWDVIRHISDFSLSHIVGATLAFLAAVIAALILLANRWADEASVFAEHSLDPKRDILPKKSWLAMYVELRAMRIAVVPLVLLAVVLNSTGTAEMPSLSAMLLALFAGVLIRTPTQICLRTAYSHSDDAALPTIESSLPLVSFVVLGASQQIDVQQWDGLVLGVIATTLGLALLNFEVDGYRRDYSGNNQAITAPGLTVADDDAMPRARHGFKALMLTMYCTGLFVYFRPTDDLETVIFRWRGEEYWGLVALSATGFFLLLAFRLTYIRNRIDAEEQKVAHLVRNIELLQRFEVFESKRHVGHELIQDILAVDRIRNPQQVSDALDARTADPPDEIVDRNDYESILSRNYDKARIAFDDAWTRINEQTSSSCSDDDSGPSQKEERSSQPSIAHPQILELSTILASVEEGFDTFTHSRQHGGSFGDFFSVGILGVATLLLTLGGLPRSTDVTALSEMRWSSFLMESFAILFSATLVFLMFSLYDEITERRIPLYVGLSERSKETPNRREIRLKDANAYGIWFRSDVGGGIVARRVVAASLGMVVYAGLVILLLSKWGIVTLPMVA